MAERPKSSPMGLAAAYGGLPGDLMSVMQRGLNYGRTNSAEMSRRYAELPTLFPTSDRVLGAMGNLSKDPPQGPQFPFSRALSSGPLGQLLAEVAGAPVDLQQIAHRTLPPGSAPAVASMPTMQQIKLEQERQNANPPPVSYSTIWSMLPEMSLMLRGAPTPEAVPAWLKDRSWSGPAQQPTAQPNATAEQGWTLQKILQDLIGGSKPAH